MTTQLSTFSRSDRDLAAAVSAAQHEALEFCHTLESPSIITVNEWTAAQDGGYTHFVTVWYDYERVKRG